MHRDKSTRSRRGAKLAAIAAVPALAVSIGVVAAARADAAGCAVKYTVTNTWSGGFGVAVDITNLGDPVNGWTLAFAFPGSQTVAQLWNGTVTQSGADVTVKDAGYNAAIATNGTTSFGFNGAGTAGTPASFSLNGTVCTGATTPTTAPTTAPPTTAPPTTAPTIAPTTPPAPESGRQMEDLDRGVISVRSGSGNLVSWRLLGTEATSTGFNVYRAGTKVNATPIANSTNYLDSGAAAGSSYTVRAVVNGVEQPDSPASLSFGNGYLDVRMQIPAGGTTPSGEAFTYRADDLSVGDVDGDGQYELFVKWYPSNAKDNSQSGYTGNTLIDAYKLNGTRLWRIDLGRNIRSGAHYTQFQVYDYDGDGKAEMAVKTADGSRDGAGTIIGSSSADYRNSAGYVLSGPEFLTMFAGDTGRALSTVNYLPARGTVGDWGDTYGNRVDRFLAGTAYFDGQRPSVVMARGYYTRAVVVAWDFRNGALTRRWTYDSGNSNVGAYGQGNHNLSIADTDADGKDEVIYGSAALNDNGTLMWRSGLGHGDALHVGDFIPSRAGLEVFRPSESTSQPADAMLDGRTGAVIWSHASCGCDNGRGVAADIYAGSAGAEAWSNAVDGLSNTSGANIGRKPGSANALIWWDGDTTRELQSDIYIDKYGTGGDTRLLTGSGVASNNGTKANAGLTGDILGDWREEVLWRTTDSSAVRIYSTPTQTSTRLYTLMHDSQYRVAIAWQNTAYNQPPHPSYHIGNGMAAITKPTIYVR
ncbi:cellulose binding domain-containing protein [Paractinoplanes rishiriensis]|uniref:Rhamnogalacturonan lyase n=1 Tax=Paractinoplanes rishiriensis TaxID=1050105 RepID=A0A919N1K2_9ACTN|nr:cellulose binding domain-containing protein [Actinoplanes rishiriensis]GIF01676.1 rhamnogalacturonan lyase [Actinoplanes rishiriensis]